MSKFNKIHIIGGPGSGKSYISARISKELNVPHLNLDEIYWDKHANDYNTKTKDYIRDRKLYAVINKKNWIVEGAYKSWVMPSFQKADIVIIINPSIFVRDYRLFRRFIRRKLGIEKGNKESLKNFIELISYNHRWNDSLTKIRTMIKEAKTKSKEFRSTDDAVKFILKN